MENHTAKHFVLQLGSLASLYLSLSFLLVLLFGVINILFPDAVDSSWDVERAHSGIRIGIAMVVVFFPTYITLTRLVNKNRRHEGSGKYLGLTKWLIYLSLLVGGAVLLGDLVAVVMAFLEGEITTRFTLKALAVLVVIGLAFLYYLKDAKGYWVENERQSIVFAGVACTLVLSGVAAGLLLTESPSETRERRLDNQTIGDLQDMQWRIEDYYRTENSLPAVLTEVYRGSSAPTAPEGREAYVYEVESEIDYTLCATFVMDDEVSGGATRFPWYEENYNWNYDAGYYCFERTIDNEYRQ